MMEGINGKVFLLLAGSGLCSAFGGLQSITVLEWIQPLLLFQFLHHVKLLDRKPSSIAALLLATLLTQTLGLTIAYAGEFNNPVFTFKGVYTTFAVCLLAWVILLFAFLTDLKYKKRFPGAISSHPFTFPCIWTLVWLIESSFAPIGATGNPAYSQHSIQPIVLLVALWGLDGIVFFMALTATVVHQRLILRQEAGENSWFVSVPWGTTSESAFSISQQNGNLRKPVHMVSEIEDGEATKSERRKKTDEFVSKVKQHDHVVSVWLSILLLSLVYSGCRRVIFSGSFYEKGILDTIRPTVGVSCLLRQPTELFDGQVDFLWNATSERARAGDGFIVWSESATIVQGIEAEEELLSKGGKIVALEHERRQKLNGKGLEREGPYLGLSYFLSTGQGVFGYNVFTLLLPNGTVGFRYEKSHPVPFVEVNAIPGQGKLKAVDTPFGRVSAAICFDFQFPRLLEQAAYLGADIVLQPSWTWGPIAKTQLKADAFRAVENGFTFVRCSSMGQSAVVNAFNEVIDLRESTEKSVVTMQLPLTPRLWTVYPYGGFIVGILVAIVAVNYLFMAWLPLKWVNGVWNVFPVVVNQFFSGNTDEEEGIVVGPYQRIRSFAESNSRRRLLP